MTISFNSIPSTERVPFLFAEFDSSKAQQGPSLLKYTGFIIGQKLAGGSATADQAYKIASEADVIALAGRGSMLHRQVKAWLANNKANDLWIGVLADNGAGVAAQGTITVTVTTAVAGTICLYLGGERIPVGVNANDAQNTIATNIAAAITAAADLPITAVAVANVVTWTFRHKGTVGNSYDARVNARDGESLPGGVTIAIAATTAGTTNPTLTNLITYIRTMWFQVWAHPYTDSTSLGAIETELASRFGPSRQIAGVAVTGAVGTLSTLTTLGTSRNSGLSIIVAPPGQSPMSPPMEFAAEAAALLAYYGSIDPARPFQTLAMARSISTAITDQWTLDERNTLLFSGIATTARLISGGFALERMITTYQLNASSQPDTAYLDSNTPLTLIYLRYSFRVRIQTKYPRHKLASDGTQFGSGQAIMTPRLGKAEAVGWFDDMVELGLVEDVDQFKRDLVVERDSGDPNRLNWLLPPNLINQLVVNAAQIQFLL